MGNESLLTVLLLVVVQRYSWVDYTHPPGDLARIGWSFFTFRSAGLCSDSECVAFDWITGAAPTPEAVTAK